MKDNKRVAIIGAGDITGICERALSAQGAHVHVIDTSEFTINSTPVHKGLPDRELTPEREAEVKRKFENLRKNNASKPFLPDFPPYQNLEVPAGHKLGVITLTNDNWIFLGKRYIVCFEFEIVFQTVRSREKKIASMDSKMTALLKLSSHTELSETPGFTVQPYVEPIPAE